MPFSALAHDTVHVLSFILLSNDFEKHEAFVWIFFCVLVSIYDPGHVVWQYLS